MGFLIPKSRAGMLWRFFLAAIIVIGACAATTAVAGLLQFSQLAQDISIHAGITSNQIQLPAPGKPQTILLIGSDHRAGAPVRGANTDTMLLVRLNAASSTINVMSLPRDLKVDIPGDGINKLNAAYSLGSYNLLIKTIRANVLPGFHPNHIIDTNFTGFSKIVDALGCVYSDVDQRYYNISAPGPTNFSSIDIQPGYQKLCGHNQSISGALPFVRFRHTDTDIVRNARQQDFLRWAKDQFSTSQLFNERDKLLLIFGRYSTLDKNLQSPSGLINLFDLVLSSNGSTIKQVHFPAILQNPNTPGPNYVTANPALVQQRYREFLAPTTRAKAPAKPRTSGATHSGHAKHGSGSSQINTAGLTADPAGGRAQAAALTNPRMPVYYPRYIKAGTYYCTVVQGNCDDPVEPAAAYAHSYPRQYLIPTRAGTKVPAWRMTLVINGTMGEYYGIQGVAWSDPPLLRKVSATKLVNGRKLYLYANGGHLTTVAWHQGGDSYWVSNDLTSSIPNSQLVGIAASMVRYR